MKKKMFALVLAILMFVTFTAFKAPEVQTEESINVKKLLAQTERVDAIKTSVLNTLDDTAGFDYECVPSGSEIYLVGTRVDGEEVTKEVVAPYILDENGDAQNAFVYHLSQPGSALSPMNTFFPTTKDGLTMRVRGSYYESFSMSLGLRYFRPTGLSINYSTTSSAVQVQHLYAAFGAKGDLYDIPNDKLIQKDYFRSTSVSQSLPVAAKTYSSVMTGYTSTQGIVCVDNTYENAHGGLLYGETEYYYNGSYRILYIDHRGEDSPIAIFPEGAT